MVSFLRAFLVSLILSFTRANDIKKIVKNANASLEMEGLKPSKFAVGLAKRQLAGRISKEEVTRLIAKKYTR